MSLSDDEVSKIVSELLNQNSAMSSATAFHAIFVCEMLEGEPTLTTQIGSDVAFVTLDSVTYEIRGLESFKEEQ